VPRGAGAVNRCPPEPAGDIIQISPKPERLTTKTIRSSGRASAAPTAAMHTLSTTIAVTTRATTPEI